MFYYLIVYSDNIPLVCYFVILFTILYNTLLVCSLPKVTGPCEAYIPRYYYNKKVMKCLRFIYGGCEGNKNNFETLKQCKQRCELEGRD